MFLYGLKVIDCSVYMESTRRTTFLNLLGPHRSCKYRSRVKSMAPISASKFVLWSQPIISEKRTHNTPLLLQHFLIYPLRSHLNKCVKILLLDFFLIIYFLINYLDIIVRRLNSDKIDSICNGVCRFSRWSTFWVFVLHGFALSITCCICLFSKSVLLISIKFWMKCIGSS